MNLAYNFSFIHIPKHNTHSVDKRRWIHFTVQRRTQLYLNRKKTCFNTVRLIASKHANIYISLTRRDLAYN